MQDYLNIAVTGDVDSGKSTLIGRFLYDTGSIADAAIEEIKDVSQRITGDFEFAYLLDSFEEERKSKLTIETTQAFCKTKKGKRFIFIDVPGHQELLKNMLCGSSYADMAILVIDVQSTIEEQTKRHLSILKFLDIENIIVVLNKMDLVNFNEDVFRHTEERIAEFFKNIGIRYKYFIPVSARQGDNLIKKSKEMIWYKGLSLIEALNGSFKGLNSDVFRFPIQDIYNIDKEKVAVGKIISGKIRKGERIKILPLNRVNKVKRLKLFNQNKFIAKAPMSIGIVLDDMDGLKRGQIICKTKLPSVSREISAKIFCVNKLNPEEELRFRCVTQESSAQIINVNSIWDIATLEKKNSQDILDKTNIAEVVILTDIPVTTEKYKGFNSLGRFVLQNNDSEICAVGIII
jgi:small GTP-binding protein